jgi:hypothetical protein
MKLNFYNNLRQNRILKLVKKTGLPASITPQNPTSYIEGDELSVCLLANDDLIQNLFLCSPQNEVRFFPNLDYSNGKTYNLIVDGVFYNSNISSDNYAEDWILNNLPDKLSSRYVDGSSPYLSIKNISLENVKITFISSNPFNRTQIESNLPVFFNESNNKFGFCLGPSSELDIVCDPGFTPPIIFGISMSNTTDINTRAKYLGIQYNSEDGTTYRENNVINLITDGPQNYPDTYQSIVDFFNGLHNGYLFEASIVDAGAAGNLVKLAIKNQINQAIKLKLTLTNDNGEVNNTGFDLYNEVSNSSAQDTNGFSFYMHQAGIYGCLRYFQLSSLPALEWKTIRPDGNDNSKQWLYESDLINNDTKGLNDIIITLPPEASVGDTIVCTYSLGDNYGDVYGKLFYQPNGTGGYDPLPPTIIELQEADINAGELVFKVSNFGRFLQFYSKFVHSLVPTLGKITATFTKYGKSVSVTTTLFHKPFIFEVEGYRGSLEDHLNNAWDTNGVDPWIVKSVQEPDFNGHQSYSTELELSPTAGSTIMGGSISCGEYYSNDSLLIDGTNGNQQVGYLVMKRNFYYEVQVLTISGLHQKLNRVLIATPAIGSLDYQMGVGTNWDYNLMNGNHQNYRVISQDGKIYKDRLADSGLTSPALQVGDVIGIAYNVTTNEVFYYKNGVMLFGGTVDLSAASQGAGYGFTVRPYILLSKGDKIKLLMNKSNWKFSPPAGYYELL